MLLISTSEIEISHTNRNSNARVDLVHDPNTKFTRTRFEIQGYFIPIVLHTSMNISLIDRFFVYYREKDHL